MGESQRKSPTLSNIQFKDSADPPGSAFIGNITFNRNDDVKGILTECEAIAMRLIDFEQKKNPNEREIRISVKISLPQKDEETGKIEIKSD